MWCCCFSCIWGWVEQLITLFLSWTPTNYYLNCINGQLRQHIHEVYQTYCACQDMNHPACTNLPFFIVVLATEHFSAKLDWCNDLHHYIVIISKK